MSAGHPLADSVLGCAPFRHLGARLLLLGLIVLVSSRLAEA